MKLIRPDRIEIGSLVWYRRSDVVIGPLLVVDKRLAGFGSNSHWKWILHDTATGDIHQSSIVWLKVLAEEQ